MAFLTKCLIHPCNNDLIVIQACMYVLNMKLKSLCCQVLYPSFSIILVCHVFLLFRARHMSTIV